MEEIAKGIEFEVDPDKKKLTLIIDITGAGAVSSSGKSRVIASTRGNILIPGTDGLKMGLNLYRSIT